MRDFAEGKRKCVLAIGNGDSAATNADGPSFSSMVGQAAADNIVEIRRRLYAAE